MPRINVVIPVWNRAHIIGRVVGSILGQDVPADDWSIRAPVDDDGSTDDLASALRRFRDAVSGIRHEHNAGAAAARNTGIWHFSIRTTCGFRTSSPGRLRSCGRAATPSVALLASWRVPEG